MYLYGTKRKVSCVFGSCVLDEGSSHLFLSLSLSLHSLAVLTFIHLYSFSTFTFFFFNIVHSIHTPTHPTLLSTHLPVSDSDRQTTAQAHARLPPNSRARCGVADERHRVATEPLAGELSLRMPCQSMHHTRTRRAGIDWLLVLSEISHENGVAGKSCARTQHW